MRGQGKTLEHVAGRGGGFPMPGKIRGQFGWGSEQPHRVEDVPGY